jgi:hypothetical protein
MSNTPSEYERVGEQVPYSHPSMDYLFRYEVWQDGNNQTVHTKQVIEIGLFDRLLEAVAVISDKTSDEMETDRALQLLGQISSELNLPVGHRIARLAMSDYARGYRAALVDDQFAIEGNNLADLAGVKWTDKTPAFQIQVGISDRLRRKTEMPKDRADLILKVLAVTSVVVAGLAIVIAGIG